jgi:DNA primase
VTVKRCSDLREIAKGCGIRVAACGSALCPFHDDHHPSAVFRRDHFRCFACGIRCDVIDFVQRFLRLDFASALEWLARRAGVASGGAAVQPRSSHPDPAPHAACSHVMTSFCTAARLRLGARRHQPAFDWLARRGISTQTAVTAGLGYVADYGRASDWLRAQFSPDDLRSARLCNAKGNLVTYRHRLLLPAWCDGEVWGLRARNIAWDSDADGAKELGVGPSRLPFNADVLLAPLDEVFVCEGAMDALALAELGLPAVGVPGANGFKPWWVRLFDQVAEIVLALDADAAGRAATADIAAMFARAGRAVKRLALPPQCKDCNDMLLALGQKGSAA